MKRLIKFRGKRTDTGEWIYGDLLTSNRTECEISDWNDVVYSRYDVDKDTVGQFTGLLDRNGKEIYEGDIVHVHDFANAYSSPYIGRVAMMKGRWCVEYHNQFRCVPSLFFDDFAGKKTKVIGNEFDNPELLEGGSHE